MEGNSFKKMSLEEAQNEGIFKRHISSFENDEPKNNINQNFIEDDKFSNIQYILSINQNHRNYEPEPGFFKDIDDKYEEYEKLNNNLNFINESDINKTLIVNSSCTFVQKPAVISCSQKYSNKYFDYKRFKDKPLKKSLDLSSCLNNSYYNFSGFNLNKNNSNNPMIFLDHNRLNFSNRDNSFNNSSNYLNNNTLSKEFENLFNFWDNNNDIGISYASNNNSSIQKFEYDNKMQKK